MLLPISRSQKRTYQKCIRGTRFGTQFIICINCGTLSSAKRSGATHFQDGLTGNHMSEFKGKQLKMFTWTDNHLIFPCNFSCFSLISSKPSFLKRVNYSSCFKLCLSWPSLNAAYTVERTGHVISIQSFHWDKNAEYKTICTCSRYWPKTNHSGELQDLFLCKSDRNVRAKFSAEYVGSMRFSSFGTKKCIKLRRKMVDRDLRPSPFVPRPSIVIKQTGFNSLNFFDGTDPNWHTFSVLSKQIMVRCSFSDCTSTVRALSQQFMPVF